MDFNHIAVVVVSLIVSAIFSGLEVAFISVDRLQVELQAKRGRWPGTVLLKWVDKPATFINDAIVGRLLFLVIYGVFLAKAMEPLLSRALAPSINSEAMVLTVQVLFASVVVLLTAEITPKSLFLLNPNRTLAILTPFIWIMHYLLAPVKRLTMGFAKFLFRAFGIPFPENGSPFGLTDFAGHFKNTLLHERDKEREVDKKIFTNALEFKTVKIRDCMIPRTDVEAVDEEDGIEELRETFIRSGHSKILVYKDSIDDIIGYCHSLEMFKKPKDIAAILNPILIVPETMLANELMIQFITEHKSIALVVDEFGGTSGLVTMEDIIEKIFGDIQDEHDVEEWVEQKVDENTYLLSARHEIDYLNETYGWKLPEGDYDTLGGLILSITEDLPDINEVVEYPPYSFTIVSMEDNRIDTVKLTINRTKESGN